MRTPPFHLAVIIAERSLSIPQAAKEIGTAPLQLRRWLKGEAEPSPSKRQAIEAFTEGRVPATADWNEHIGTIPIPAPLPAPEAMLCWADLPDSVGLDVMRRELRLPSLVPVTHLARQLNVATAEEVSARFRTMGYVVAREERTWRGRTMMLSVPCTPLLPGMRPA